MAKEDDLEKADPQGELGVLDRDANLAVGHGQMRRAMELFKEVEDKELRLDLKEMRSTSSNLRPCLQRLPGNRSSASSGADAAIKQSQTPTNELAWPTFTHASGMDAKARQLVDQAAQQRPLDYIHPIPGWADDQGGSRNESGARR